MDGPWARAIIGSARDRRSPNREQRLSAGGWASVVRWLEEVPPEHFTLDWLLGRLGKRSFGIIMLLLAVVAIAPGVSIVAGLLLVKLFEDRRLVDVRTRTRHRLHPDHP